MGVPFIKHRCRHRVFWLRRGNYISPAPPFLPAGRRYIICLCSLLRCSGRSRGLTCPPAAANSSSPASRAAAEGLRCAAFDCVAFAPCRLLSQAVLSHPLRGAYRAYCAGLQRYAVFLIERRLVELKGLEPSTSCLQSRCSSH